MPNRKIIDLGSIFAKAYAKQSQEHGRGTLTQQLWSGCSSCSSQWNRVRQGVFQADTETFPESRLRTDVQQNFKNLYHGGLSHASAFAILINPLSELPGCVQPVMILYGLLDIISIVTRFCSTTMAIVSAIAEGDYYALLNWRKSEELLQTHRVCRFPEVVH